MAVAGGGCGGCGGRPLGTAHGERRTAGRRFGLAGVDTAPMFSGRFQPQVSFRDKPLTGEISGTLGCRGAMLAPY